MLDFTSDYNCGIHPVILNALIATNDERATGYGDDPFTRSAAKKIKSACGRPEAEVTFISGGTQANQFVIDTSLKSYEGVVAAHTGHIASHEAGAIEYTGHKVLELPQHNGKMAAGELRKYLETFYADGNHEHMVFPGMVYISHPTEYGTLYSKAELSGLSEVCREYGIPLYMDGARLAYGIASLNTDLTLRDIADLTDIFYIGGTKCGCLFGEAIVYTRGNKPAHFAALLKQHGALLAKGRALGVQFDAMFSGDTFFSIGRSAIDSAERLKTMLAAKGFEFLIESPTNQQFVILENDYMAKLAEKVKFAFWEQVDEGHTAVRFATSWATTDRELDELEGLL